MIVATSMLATVLLAPSSAIAGGCPLTRAQVARSLGTSVNESSLRDRLGCAFGSTDHRGPTLVLQGADTPSTAADLRQMRRSLAAAPDHRVVTIRGHGAGTFADVATVGTQGASGSPPGYVITVYAQRVTWLLEVPHPRGYPVGRMLATTRRLLDVAHRARPRLWP